MTPAIEIRSLSKFFDGRAAVAGLDWTVEPGTAWGLLGPNGAGKSTTLRVLMGFTLPSQGTAQVLGEDCRAMSPAVREKLGYVAEEPVLPPWLRVEEMVRFHRRFYPRWDGARERELLGVLELPPRARISTLSKGQNRRLMLLLALCQGSELLLLDEPAAGLDVAARRQLLALLGDFLAEEQRTLVLSSHIVTDVERIVSHVAIVSRGRLVEAVPLDELHEQVKRVRLPRELWGQSADAWTAAGLLQSEAAGGTHTAVVRSIEAVPSELTERPEVEVMALGLEDIYLAITEAARPHKREGAAS